MAKANFTVIAILPGRSRDYFDFCERGVTVNALCPGPIRTRALDRPADAALAEAIASIPVGFLGDVSDVAAMAALLASDEGRFITGQSILVNGGRWWL